MDKKKNKQILVKITCVIVSFILWLYIANTENPEISKRFSVPVNLIHQELLSKSKLAIIPEENYTVQIKVKGPILEVNRLKVSDFQAITDLSLYALKKGKNSIPVVVKLKNVVSNIAIVEQENLWVEISLDDYVEKNVPVKADVKVSAKTGFKVFPKVIKPTSATIGGAAQYVNNVSYVMAKGDNETTDRNVEVNLPLEAYNNTDDVIKGVLIKPSNVNIVVPIKKTKTVGIKVKTVGNLKNNAKLVSVVPQSDTIVICGEDNVLNAINSLDTESIDLSSIDESETVTTKLILTDGVILASEEQNINVKITVDNTITQNYSVDIKFNNPNEKYNFTADKTKVSVVLKGSQANISTLKIDDIKCSADLTNLKDGSSQVVPVKIQVPDGIIIVSINPQNIKVDIVLKPSNNTTNVGNANNTNSENNNSTNTNAPVTETNPNNVTQ